MKTWKALAAALGFALTAFAVPSTAVADGCYICQSGSSCGAQCRYGSSDTQAARKDCEKRGCKIGGTTSCSTAANIKVCVVPTVDNTTASLSVPWCSAT